MKNTLMTLLGFIILLTFLFSPGSLFANPEKIFFSSMKNGNLDLFMINVDGTGLKQISFGEENESDPQISPNGRILSFKKQVGNGTDLFIQYLGSKNIQRLTFYGDTQSKSDYAANYWWHNNSKQIIVEVNHSATESTIYRIDIDSSQTKVFIDNRGDKDMNPVANPANRDEYFFIYDSGNWSPNRQIRKFDFSTGRQTIIQRANNREDSQLSISPDGQFLIWAQNDHSYNNNRNICIMKINGRKERKLTHGKGKNKANQLIHYDAPCFSPDGSRIVFRSNLSGDYDLYIMGADGRNIGRLYGEKSINENSPFWAKVSTDIFPGDAVRSTKTREPPVTGSGTKRLPAKWVEAGMDCTTLKRISENEQLASEFLATRNVVSQLKIEIANLENQIAMHQEKKTLMRQINKIGKITNSLVGTATSLKGAVAANGALLKPLAGALGIPLAKGALITTASLLTINEAFELYDTVKEFQIVQLLETITDSNVKLNKFEQHANLIWMNMIKARQMYLSTCR